MATQPTRPNAIEMVPIGVVRGGRAEPVDDDWGDARSEIVEVDQRIVTVRGLDAIDGTPVLDLKPYMVEFAPRTPVRQPAWSHELMRDYWEISFTAADPDGSE